MDAPSWFTRRLGEEFGGRLRIRWSPRTQVWVVEERVGRAALPPIRVAEGDDGMIRARDGYAYVLTITPGDRIPCPECGATLKIPVLTFHETECGECKAARRVGGRVRAAYFPLDSRALLDYLHQIDPLRGANEDLLQRVDAERARWEAEREARFRDGMQQELFDAAIHQLPKVGYTTGKVFA